MVSDRLLGAGHLPARLAFQIALAAWGLLAVGVQLQHGSIVAWPLMAAGYLTIAASARLTGKVLSRRGASRNIRASTFSSSGTPS